MGTWQCTNLPSCETWNSNKTPCRRSGENCPCLIPISFHFDLLNRFLLWQSIINISLLSCFIHPSVEFIPNPLVFCTIRILSFPSLPFPLPLVNPFPVYSHTQGPDSRPRPDRGTCYTQTQTQTQTQPVGRDRLAWLPRAKFSCLSACLID